MTSLKTIRAKDFAPFYQNSVGIDQLFDNLLSTVNVNTQSNYPPYNIIKNDDNNYLIEVAVAGFSEGDIKVTVEQNVLNINAENSDEETTDEFVHRGISSRKFSRTFNLAEHIEIKAAKVENGILSLVLEREIPEQLMPKSIEIEYRQ
jgi:molecular chaperone IbpA